jgi:hypothetical protein
VSIESSCRLSVISCQRNEVALAIPVGRLNTRTHT